MYMLGVYVSIYSGIYGTGNHISQFTVYEKSICMANSTRLRKDLTDGHHIRLVCLFLSFLYHLFPSILSSHVYPLGEVISVWHVN